MAKIKYDAKTLITEDDVENKFLQELFTKELGYDINKDLKWKEAVKYQEGRKKLTKFADLIIYKNDKAVMVVETKKPTESVTDNLGQVDSYSFAKEVRYSIITNGRKIILREYLAANKKANIINMSIEKLHQLNYIPLINIVSKEKIDTNIENEILDNQNNSNEITDYRRFFRSIHNIIRDNEKLDPASCFDEFSKILYLKMADEQYRNDKEEENDFDLNKFKNVPRQEPMKLINDWFKDAMRHYYSDVFEEIPELKVSLATLEKVLIKLENFYVKDDKMDIKGRAFEEFLPSQLRGKGLGQFFTPRKIVDFMVDLADVDINDTIVDFACGSGGFLIKSFDKMKEILNRLPDATFKSICTTKEKFAENLKKEQIFGIDAEPRAVRIAKMNMILWGDGRKIVRGNGLAKRDWQNMPYPLSEYDENNDNSGCSLILANPPFIKEKDPEILKMYFLAEGKNSVDAQTLFLERGINLLRPGGRMLIVLPEGILSNDDSIKTREYILKNAKIKAIIELPTHTFVQSGVDTINTVVLYLEKYETDLKKKIDELTNENNTTIENINTIKNYNELDYNIFLASAENVGFEPNGRVFIRKGEKTDLDIILEKYKTTDLENEKINIIDNSLKDYEIASKNMRGKQNLNDVMKINIKNIENRLDPSYYLFWKNIGNDFDDFVPLSEYNIKFYNNKLKLLTEEDLDKEFTICSVNKNNYYNLLEFSEYKTGDELSHETQKKMIVKKGTIVYNPYRASIGSFSIVPEEFDNCLTSGAYYNFSVEDFDEQLLVTLFKTPIYNKYIKILSTGTVRDNFSDTYLEKILVPKLDKEQQKELLKILSNKNDSILEKQKEIKNDLVEKMTFLYKKLNIQ